MEDWPAATAGINVYVRDSATVQGLERTAVSKLRENDEVAEDQGLSLGRNLGGAANTASRGAWIYRGPRG
jgi:hypothetical protein